MGHRKSIDFDLFTNEKNSNTTLKKSIIESGFSNKLIVALSDQIHFIINGVKLTFFEFPYKIEASEKYKDIFILPDLLTLAAMKAFALGGRRKWKDYVDLYFIIKDHYSIEEISNKAKGLFTDSFNPLLFRKQISYFEDINYTESVDFMPGFEVEKDTIKAFLIEKALEKPTY